MKIIAIDAGASKTRVIQSDSTKPSDYKEIILSPCNYLVHGKKRIKELTESILTKFKIKSAGKYYVVAGIAGTVTASSKNEVAKIFKSYGFLSKRITIFSDAELLINSIGNDGIVLIAGTGAICIGRKKSADGNYIEAKAGGYGYIFNSEPGGYSLGIKAIKISLDIEDGISKTKSYLPEKIKHHFGVKSMRELIPLIYVSKKIHEEIATLVPIILECAKYEDPIPVQLLKGHTDSMSGYIRAVYSKLGFDKANVYIHGGLFKNRLSKKLLIDPMISHKSLKELNINFKVLGVNKPDKDPLLEVIKTITSK